MTIEEFLERRLDRHAGLHGSDEVDALRRMVRRETCHDAPDCGDPDCVVIWADKRIIASIWAHHPEFQEEWRL